MNLFCQTTQTLSARRKESREGFSVVHVVLGVCVVLLVVGSVFWCMSNLNQNVRELRSELKRLEQTEANLRNKIQNSENRLEALMDGREICRKAQLLGLRMPTPRQTVVRLGKSPQETRVAKASSGIPPLAAPSSQHLVGSRK